MKGEPVNESDKRQRIIQAAIKVFASHGYHPARVEQIAAMADVGKGTVYEYFQSKEHVFQEVLAHIMEEYVQAISAVAGQADHVRERLEQLLLVNIEFVSRHRDMAQLLLSDHPSLGDEGHHKFIAQRNRCLAVMQQIISEGIASGQLRPVNPELAALLLDGAVSAVAGQVIFSSDLLDWHDATNQIIEMLLQGMATRT